MTFSIVARDAGSGELGVATHSRHLAVGATVPWARAGVGAIATQALAEPAHGPSALDLLAADASATESLSVVLASDPLSEFRQVGVVDSEGRAAVHTGARCIAFAEHAVGQDHVALANIASRPGLADAMSAAFADTTGSLAQQLVASLGAGEQHGGDLRGRQSAALLVVSGNREDPIWSTRADLRVDDHGNPIAELARLLDLQEVNRYLSLGLTHLFAGHVAEANDALEIALQLAPADAEVNLWNRLARETGSTVAHPDGEETDPRWAELRRRIEETGVLDAISRPTTDQG